MLKKLSKQWVILVTAVALVASIVLSSCSSAASSTPVPAQTTTSKPAVTTTTPAAPVTTSAAPTTTTPPAPASTTPVVGAMSLNGAGATFPNPLYSKWFDEYNKLTGVKINYQSVGSGTGIQQITAGTVDFGASDGIMTADQIAAAEKAFGPIQHIPMTSGSEAIIYNLPGIASGTIKLSGPVLADIYLKNITKWNDPKITALNSGVDLPDTSIAVVHRSDGSGTTFIFTNYLSKVSPDWSSKVGNANSVSWPGDIGGNGNAGVAGSVAQTPGAIGYVELAYAKQNKLPWVKLQNAAGNFVEPDIAGTTAAADGVALPDDMKIMITNSTNAKAYPIAGFTWILVYTNQTDKAKGTTLVNMLWWAIHEGQQFTTPLDYAPLSPSALTKAENEIRAIKYQGQALITK